jgi:nitrogen fixation/metabolism regulation signal transduction histidine kinase
MAESTGEMEKTTRKRKGRSRILWEITALLVVVLVASGLVIFFVVRASQGRLIDKSTDKLLASSAEDVSSFYDFIIKEKTPDFIEFTLTEGTSVIAEALAQRRLSESQKYVSEELRKIAEMGLLGVDLNMVIFISYAQFPLPEPLLFACNDESLIYSWSVPEDVVSAFQQGEPYVYRKNGIPELGLEGEYLIITKKIEDPELGYVAGYIGIKPMDEEIASINEFYSKESRKTSLTLGLVVGISILAVILISFFILSYLLRKRITEPIEELASSAGEVMDGNLDVDVRVHVGGDFANLERAFKEMLESIRQMIEKSVSEE